MFVNSSRSPGIAARDLKSDDEVVEHGEVLRAGAVRFYIEAMIALGPGDQPREAGANRSAGADFGQ